MADPKTTHEDLVEISRLDLESSAPADATITDVEHLASYNWIEASTPTIAVPGSPAYWSAPRGPRAVRKDSGLIYIAQNAARHPDSPLEPLFRSLYVEQPSFDINSIDVVTDRNNIRKLLSFVNAKLNKHGLESFTIQVDIAAQTAIFCRDETATSEVIGPSEFRGYGHEFEKAYTIDQIKGSTGHHRIVRYRLGDLQFLVRHETDGFVSDLKPVVKKETGDDLATILGSLSLSPEPTPADNISVHSKLTIKNEGKVIPRESTLEIKTRVFHKNIELSEVAPQLWVSQTPKLVRAYHQRGVFSVPKVEDVGAALKDWEKAHQNDIKKLVALINRILQVTRSWGGNATIQYDAAKDKLVVKKVKRKKMLPDDLYRRWTDVIPAGVSQKSSEQKVYSPSDTKAVEAKSRHEETDSVSA